MRAGLRIAHGNTTGDSVEPIVKGVGGSIIEDECLDERKMPRPLFPVADTDEEKLHGVCVDFLTRNMPKVSRKVIVFSDVIALAVALTLGLVTLVVQNFLKFLFFLISLLVLQRHIPFVVFMDLIPIFILAAILMIDGLRAWLAQLFFYILNIILSGGALRWVSSMYQDKSIIAHTLLTSRSPLATLIGPYAEMLDGADRLKWREILSIYEKTRCGDSAPFIDFLESYWKQMDS